MVTSGLVLLGLGLFLFFAGLVQCLTSKKFLGFIFGLEIIINSANVNLAGFLVVQPQRTDLQSIMVMTIAVAAIEAVVGLAIFTWISKMDPESDFSLI
jgi:NADH:ubiquinone oxidoreductase subunit K